MSEDMSSSGVNLEHYLIPLEEIKRATENFSQQRCIGGGGFGAVYKGQLSERWQNRAAAIKQLSRDSFQGEREFRNELELISRFHHENIISFIGYCDEDKEMIIVYEYAMNGSLDHHLQDPSKMSCITWTQRLMICIGAARGLSYLHSGLGELNRVIHRDVKSSNILLDNNLVAKICDFGLSKSGPRNQTDTQVYTKVAGTPFYVDPIYIESSILRKESDVYSFGVVLFEILSGKLVYHEEKSSGDKLMTSVRRYQTENEPDRVIDPHIRDQIKSSSFNAFQEIAYQCISYNSTERPTMDNVVESIEKALTIQTNACPASTPTVPSMIELAVHKLNSTNPDDQRMAADEIHLLTRKNEDSRVAIAHAGAIPPLIRLLITPDSLTQEHAITAIFNLSNREDNKGSIVSFGAVPGIIHVLKEGNMKARENAAATLFSLTLNDKNKVTIGSLGAIPPLVLMLREGTRRGKRDATIALYNLCVHQGNKIRALEAGVVPMLMGLLREPQGVLKEEALSVLESISSHPEGKLKIGKEEAVVPVLVDVIGSGSPRIRENAAAVLVELCSIDQKYLVEAQQHGVKEKLTDLLHHGTDRGRRKAGHLLEKMSRSAEQHKLSASQRSRA